MIKNEMVRASCAYSADLDTTPSDGLRVADATGGDFVVGDNDGDGRIPPELAKLLRAAAVAADGEPLINFGDGRPDPPLPYGLAAVGETALLLSVGN
jgi:hypothetical protein